MREVAAFGFIDTVRVSSLPAALAAVSFRAVCGAAAAENVKATASAAEETRDKAFFMSNTVGFGLLCPGVLKPIEHLSGIGI